MPENSTPPEFSWPVSESVRLEIAVKNLSDSVSSLKAVVSGPMGLVKAVEELRIARDEQKTFQSRIYGALTFGVFVWPIIWSALEKSHFLSP